MLGLNKILRQSMLLAWEESNRIGKGDIKYWQTTVN